MLHSSVRDTSKNIERETDAFFSGCMLKPILKLLERKYEQGFMYVEWTTRLLECGQVSGKRKQKRRETIYVLLEANTKAVL